MEEEEDDEATRKAMFDADGEVGRRGGIGNGKDGNEQMLSCRTNE